MDWCFGAWYTNEVMRKRAQKKSIQSQVKREADKIATRKENLDALSWNRVEEIGQILQDCDDTATLEALGKELVAISQANTSLARKLGYDYAGKSRGEMASGMQMYGDDLYTQHVLVNGKEVEEMDLKAQLDEVAETEYVDDASIGLDSVFVDGVEVVVDEAIEVEAEAEASGEVAQSIEEDGSVDKMVESEIEAETADGVETDVEGGFEADSEPELVAVDESEPADRLTDKEAADDDFSDTGAPFDERLDQDAEFFACPSSEDARQVEEAADIIEAEQAADEPAAEAKQVDDVPAAEEKTSWLSRWRNKRAQKSAERAEREMNRKEKISVPRGVAEIDHVEVDDELMDLLTGQGSIEDEYEILRMTKKPTSDKAEDADKAEGATGAPENEADVLKEATESKAGGLKAAYDAMLDPEADFAAIAAAVARDAAEAASEQVETAADADGEDAGEPVSKHAAGALQPLWLEPEPAPAFEPAPVPAPESEHALPSRDEASATESLQGTDDADDVDDEPVGGRHAGGSSAYTAEQLAAFRLVYESKDGRMCIYEDASGHLVSVDASKLV